MSNFKYVMMFGRKRLRTKMSQVVRKLVTYELKNANLNAFKMRSSGMRLDVLQLTRCIAPFERGSKDSPSVT